MANKESVLSTRFTKALVYTSQLHAGQVRKGTQIPYLAHLLGVASFVLEDGGDEDEAIAALLHDAVEDQGGLDTLVEIRDKFGDRVAEIVMGCSDTYTTPKPPWRERKEKYLAHLEEASPEVMRVSIADKLHNARSIRRDLLENGNEVLSKFKGGKTGTIWYYQRLSEIFNRLLNNPMVDEFIAVVSEIDTIIENEQ